MRSLIAVLSSCSALALISGCSANVASLPDEVDSGAGATGDAPDAVDSGTSEKDATSSGTPCVVAAECPSFVCPKCPAAVVQECTGDNVCATEYQVCAAITCDSPDAG